METKRVFITGITGQDGSYLSEFLLLKGYEVHGLVRRSSTSQNFERLSHAMQSEAGSNGRLKLHFGDLSDASSLNRILSFVQPQEVYHLGAQSHVGISFDTAEYTSDVTGVGTLRLLEAIHRYCPQARFYNAASSELFGKAVHVPQNEVTPFHPRSPYAVAKLFAYWMTIQYREAHGLFASNGIMFNHESPRRGEHFVTRKVTKAVARIVAGKQDKLILGNLDAMRDWGYAPEYVAAMWSILQHSVPDDFVISTGETHTVKEFVIEAFRLVGIEDWEQYVKYDVSNARPTEVDVLRGDSSKAQKVLNWKPTVCFSELIKIMLEADLAEQGVPFDLTKKSFGSTLVK